jgi:hypothetical protein
MITRSVKQLSDQTRFSVESVYVEQSIVSNVPGRSLQIDFRRSFGAKYLSLRLSLTSSCHLIEYVFRDLRVWQSICNAFSEWIRSP